MVESSMRVMKSPRSVEIAITHRCNLRCLYCSHFTSDGDVGTDLDKDEWAAFFEELGRLGVMRVILQGGEPFIRGDLPEIIEAIIKNRMRFEILSNGTLITREMAEFLASTRRCDSVQVSIDGSNAVPHDACRGEGTFEKALMGIKHLRRQGLSTSVRVTIHRLNVADLDGVAGLLINEVGLSGFSTNAASYLGLCRQNADQVGLTVGERTRAMEVLLDLNLRYNGRISATAGPLAEAGMWAEMADARSRGKKKLPGRGYLTGCGGGFEKMSVLADGTMVPCSQLSHMAMGRINMDDLAEVWRNHAELKRLRERSRIPLSDFEFCRGCEFINYCTGNCPALAYTMTGKVNHPSPDACLKRFLDEGGRLPDNRRIAA